jgi:hypothetical protein
MNVPRLTLAADFAVDAEPGGIAVNTAPSCTAKHAEYQSDCSAGHDSATDDPAAVAELSFRGCAPRKLADLSFPARP